MNINKFENLKIEKVIIHQIYKREHPSRIITPFYNDECSSLDDDALDVLKQRITKALSHKSNAIQMEFSSSNMFSPIRDFWKSDMSDEEFIAFSIEATFKLAEAQTSRAYPGGIVVVVKGTVQQINKPFLAIIKAEKQKGFTAQETNGKMILKFFNDLLLTPHQKLQKIGFFINNAVAGREIEAKDIDSFVFDSNTNSSISVSKATYFYSVYLGLDFKKDSDVLTNKFFEATKLYINSLDVSSDTKIDLGTALLSYLKVDVSRFVNAEDFAERYFEEPELKDSYIKFVEQKEVPLSNIRKNLSMIGDKLKTRNINFSNSVKLQVPVDDFSEIVDINELEGGKTSIIIQGKVLNEK